MNHSITKQDYSILICNSLDHFDTALYGFLAPVIAPLFFPNYEPVVQIILAYSFLGTSIITRPLGAFIFGTIASKYGGLLGLSYSVIGVAITTALIGFIPDYHMIGALAPILLIIIRLIRGIFTSGESTIAKLYILENKNLNSAYKSSYFYQTSSMIGIILASIASYVVVATDYNNGWRICFWLGGFTAFSAYFLRKYSIPDNRDKLKLFNQYTTLSRFKTLWLNKKNVLRVAITTSFSHLTYFIPFVLMNSFVPMVTNISIQTMVALNNALLIFDTLLIPILGYLTRNFNPVKLMLFASTIITVTIIPLWVYLPNSTIWYVTFIRAWIVICGVLFLCPINLWYKNLFDNENKYFLVGMGNALGAAFGKLTPAITMALWHITGSTLSIALYIALIMLLTTYALYTSYLK
jgi:MFS family permease